MRVIRPTHDTLPALFRFVEAAGAPGWECRACRWRSVTTQLPESHECHGQSFGLATDAAGSTQPQIRFKG